MTPGERGRTEPVDVQIAAVRRYRAGYSTLDALAAGGHTPVAQFHVVAAIVRPTYGPPGFRVQWHWAPERAPGHSGRGGTP